MLPEPFAPPSKMVRFNLTFGKAFSYALTCGSRNESIQTLRGWVCAAGRGLAALIPARIPRVLMTANPPADSPVHRRRRGDLRAEVPDLFIVPTPLSPQCCCCLVGTADVLMCTDEVLV